jgi:hypothetical protein
MGDFIVHTAKDDAGREYKHIRTNAFSNCVLCFRKRNMVFKGKLNISLRKGAGKFGDEVVIQFIVDELLENYEAKSPFNHIEFYLPESQGLDFLRSTISELEKPVPIPVSVPVPDDDMFANVSEDDLYGV